MKPLTLLHLITLIQLLVQTAGHPNPTHLSLSESNVIARISGTEAAKELVIWNA